MPFPAATKTNARAARRCCGLQHYLSEVLIDEYDRRFVYVRVLQRTQVHGMCVRVSVRACAARRSTSRSRAQFVPQYNRAYNAHVLDYSV